jgi:ketosteroid isomerase-like protein
MGHPNEELLRQGYKDFGAGNVEAVLAIFAEDIAVHISGSNQISGDYRGHDGSSSLFGKIAQQSEGTYTQDIHDILANDTHAVCLLRGQAHRADRSLDVLEVHVWHVANGKLTEGWATSVDQAAVDAFYA